MYFYLKAVPLETTENERCRFLAATDGIFNPSTSLAPDHHFHRLRRAICSVAGIIGSNTTGQKPLNTTISHAAPITWTRFKVWLSESITCMCSCRRNYEHNWGQDLYDPFVISHSWAKDAKLTSSAVSQASKLETMVMTESSWVIPQGNKPKRIILYLISCFVNTFQTAKSAL